MAADETSSSSPLAASTSEQHAFLAPLAAGGGAAAVVIAAALLVGLAWTWRRRRQLLRRRRGAGRAGQRPPGWPSEVVSVAADNSTLFVAAAGAAGDGGRHRVRRCSSPAMLVAKPQGAGRLDIEGSIEGTGARQAGGAADVVDVVDLDLVIAQCLEQDELEPALEGGVQMQEAPLQMRELQLQPQEAGGGVAPGEATPPIVTPFGDGDESINDVNRVSFI